MFVFFLNSEITLLTLMGMGIKFSEHIFVSGDTMKMLQKQKYLMLKIETYN